MWKAAVVSFPTAPCALAVRPDVLLCGSFLVYLQLRLAARPSYAEQGVTDTTKRSIQRCLLPAVCSVPAVCSPARFLWR